MEIKTYTETCISCGISFDVPLTFKQSREKDHKTFYCPNGHTQYYPDKSDEEKLRDLVKVKDRRIDSLLQDLSEATKPNPRGRKKKDAKS